MPRNITIKFSDGSAHVYQNAPDNITPAQVQARAQKEFVGKQIIALDGGRNPAQSPVPVATARQATAAAGPKPAAPPEGWGSWLLRQGKGVVAGVNDATYGIPSRIATAISHPVDALHAVTRNDPAIIADNQRSHDQLVQASRAAPVASIGANILESLLTGKAEAAGISNLATKAAASATPIVAHAGNVLQAVTDFKRGQTLRNVGRAAIVGGAQGTANAIGQGTDIGTGAEDGAAGGALLQGGASAAKVLFRPAIDVLGISGVGSYLRRFTTMTVDQAKQAVADFRTRTGAEPTLAEILPKADRDSILQNTVTKRPAIVDQVTDAVKARTANIQPEMADVVQAATAPQQRATQKQLLRSLADANGGTPANGDSQLALKASLSPTDMLALRREESRRIMAPHDDSHVADSFDDLIPTHYTNDPVVPRTVDTGVLGPDGKPILKTVAGNTNIQQVESDPEVSRAIRSVAGGLPVRPDGQGINVRDVTNMISDLRDDASQGGIEGRAAARAAEHLMGLIADNAPQAALATDNMREAFAAHSRMAEGMGEGWQQRLRDEIQVGTNGGKAQGVQNAYDTDEGVAGRQLGQTNRLTSDITNTTPEKAVANTINLARSGDPAIAENLGQNAADKIQSAAQAQTQSAENLSSSMRAAQGNDDSATLAPGDIAGGLLALSPHSFMTTKAHFLKKLAAATWLPEAKAKNLADMLFSQDPRLTNQAVNLLNSSPNGKGLLGALVAGNVATSPASGTAPANAQEPAAAPSDDTDAALAALAAQAPDASGNTPVPGEAPTNPSGYRVQLEKFLANEDPAFVNLVGRVQGRESQHKQTNPDGTPVTSKAGAIGMMQVMPGTAPEAAQAAGVPYDPQAYKTDGDYNTLIGSAYLAKMLHRYGGSVPHALAAYNAGPGAVDNALAAAHEDGNWVAHLPGETQAYVSALS